MKKKLVTAIILAAGDGRRFDTKKLKQFARVQNIPLLRRVLSHLTAFTFIDNVVVVTPPQKRLAAEKIGTSFARKHHLPVKFVVGGSSRQQSTHNALKELTSNPPSHVLIFDANRITSPLFTKEVYKKGVLTGAAVLGRELTDSLGEAHAADLDSITPLKRNSRLRLIYTPHCYAFSVLADAHRNAPPGEHENAELVAMRGTPISFVRCPLLDVKVTFKEDLALLHAHYGMTKE